MGPTAEGPVGQPAPVAQVYRLQRLRTTRDLRCLATPPTGMRPFAFTIFAGAFLLFAVQPLVGKYILPWFGGGPGVWATCLLFFQTFLVGGYIYAHFSATRLSPRKQAWVHAGLLVL